MEKKQTIYKIKGMSRDLNNMSFDKEHSFENKNIRITADKDNGLLSITNEKGTKEITIYGTISRLPINMIRTHESKQMLEADYAVETTIKVVCPIKNKNTNSSVLKEFTINKGNSIGELLDVDYPYEITSSKGPISNNEDKHYFFEDDKYCYQTREDLVSRNFDSDYKPLGAAEVGDKYILFLHCDKEGKEYPDKIDLLYPHNELLYDKNLYSGNLGFSLESPIETLVDVENDNIKKVYWVDGINPLRVININKDYSSESEDPFAFVLPIKTNHIFSVEKGEPVGQFPAGVIQYAFTYFNKFGQESAVVDVSPIYYIAHTDRGASPEDIVTTSFNLTFSNLDSNWEYIRIYSIIRTSLNTTPEIKKIVDLPYAREIEYIDSNTYGENIAPTDLLYKGGEVLSASTIAQKDSTLFLGDITIQNNVVVDNEVKNLIKELNLPYLDNSKTLTIGPEPLYNGEYNSEESSDRFYDYINNLNKSSREITTFKGGETYRLGVQLQDKYGKWSDPIFIGDRQNTLYPEEQEVSDKGTIVKLPEFKLNIGNFEDIKKKGYTAIRPLIVYPQEHERTCVAQGVLCPTVYNADDRLNNRPFSQSSWFLRPNDSKRVSNVPIIDESYKMISSFNSSGKWAEFRHNYNLQLDIINGNGEFADFGYRYTDSHTIEDVVDKAYIKSQSQDFNAISSNLSINTVVTIPSNTKEDFTNKYKNNFFVDRNILTFHSPDIKDYSNIEGLNFRIIGYVPITSSKSSLEVNTGNSEILNKASLNHVNGVIKSYNKSNYAGRHLINGAYWYDYWFNSGNKAVALYNIYPWNRSTGLSFTTGTVPPTLLEKSRFSILQYSNNTVYTSNKVELYSENKLWSDNNPLVQFSDGTTYVGNYSKIISPEDNSYGYANRLLSIDDTENTTVAEAAKTYEETITSLNNLAIYTNLSRFEVKDLYSYGKTGEFSLVSSSTRDKISLIPVTYKSSTHAVIKLNNNMYLTEDITDSSVDAIIATPFWEDENITINDVGVIDDELNINSSYLILGEFYRKVDENVLFGGTSDYAIQNNLWLPAGKTINLDDFANDSSLRLTWSEGDTYYQRYDHIKTKPYDDTSLNGVTVIASFMCETRTNLDGRYDRNRIQDDYFNTTDENYNLINSVYSQQNNYFNYRILDSERFNITKFPNSIVWSKTKLHNNIIDPWLNINLASTLDLDGNKGNITSLKRFNNEIIAFQDKAVAQVLYNTRTQISATDGVPIEIANSGKVDGKRYISDNIGCLNKWSICESPNGIYFIDDYNKSINIFNTQGVQSLSEKKGFHSWINNKSSVVKWDPANFGNAITYRDPINNEILFVYEDTCLIYNELLNEFTSFYDYGKSYPFVNLNGRNIIFNDNIIYGYQEGKYNNIFGKNKEYYIDIIANENPLNDKIFTNIEFRADTYNDDESKILDNKIDFNTLSARNEYQHSLSKLSYSQNRPSNLKKKFRIWRADIPRDGKNRIRNTWTHIKLSSDATTNRKTRLHDLSVIYYV